MKKLIFYFILLGITPSVWAQNSNAPTQQAGVSAQYNLASLGGGKPIFQSFDERYEGVRGSRFFYNDTYYDGEIWLNDEKHYTKELKYRFDQLIGTVQVKYADGRELYLKISDIKIFKMFIEDKTIVFINAPVPNKINETALYQIIYYSPKLKLLRDSRKKMTRVNDTGAYSKGEIYDEIETDYRYYIQKDLQPLSEVKLSKKSFIKALPEKEKKIEALFNSSKYKGELTISKLAEMMQKLDEDN